MIRTTGEQRQEMIEAAGATRKILHRNEKAWTLLVADVLDKATDQACLCEQICGQPVQVPAHLDVWFEAQPISPRKGTRGNTEGNTRLDLAFGSILQRGTTGSGIEYGPHGSGSWVCFVESKCLSDSSTTVSYDRRRNQLTRVIENALCFGAKGGMPDRIFFTLLTPKLFQETEIGRRSRLYGYKMDEYLQDRQALRRDIDACPMPRRSVGLNLNERIERLHLNWVTFEGLLSPSMGADLDVAHPKQIPEMAARVARIASELVVEDRSEAKAR